LLEQTSEVNILYQTWSRISIDVRKHFSMISLHVRPTAVLLLAHIGLWQHLKP
jgi:hypothetical protein